MYVRHNFSKSGYNWCSSLPPVWKVVRDHALPRANSLSAPVRAGPSCHRSGHPGLHRERGAGGVTGAVGTLGPRAVSHSVPACPGKLARCSGLCTGCSRRAPRGEKLHPETEMELFGVLSGAQPALPPRLWRTSRDPGAAGASGWGP